MQQVGRVHVLETFQALVDNVLLVDIFEDIGANNSMKVRIHEVKNQVDVAVILRPDHVLQTNDVLVPGQFLEKDDLTEGALGVCCVLERIKVLFQRHDFFRPLINRLPHNAVSSLP